MRAITLLLFLLHASITAALIGAYYRNLMTQLELAL